MFFGEIPVKEAEGSLLAHTLKLPGRQLKKGRLLERQDVRDLLTVGYVTVVGARLEADDLHEDEAADQIARALAGTGLKTTPATTGRCNLVAEVDGLLVLDPQMINKINAVDESITLATAAPYQVVSRGQTVATIKIIPFAASRQNVDQAVSLASLRECCRMAPLLSKSVSLILTHSYSHTKDNQEAVLNKAEAAFRTRIESLGSRLQSVSRCEHNRRQIASAISNALSQSCDLLLICGATATVDRRDLVPAAIQDSGGQIDYFGMPADPGNLLLLAHQQQTPVVIAPGCARSLKMNGFDWVLQRLLADQAIQPADIAAMGVGGLLKDKKFSRPVLRVQNNNHPNRQAVSSVFNMDAVMVR
ncbi:MAG: molybdopterin-binding protein [Amphritea sp.]